MTPERLRQIRAVYTEALEQSGTRRGQFLEQACTGDPELLEEVSSLLKQSGDTDGLGGGIRLEEAAAAIFSNMVGSSVGHYEITAHLGSGGMGDVYQATDSKLHRSVAIKALPEAFALDSERAVRFEREARMLASLNHPHIAAIYGLEESENRKFLVMELVSGETLAERIARGPIPLDEALILAAQIAEALEAAHEKGVIHRDLKPANIKVTVEGQVKVLDFGLAKAFAAETGDSDLTTSPLLSTMAADGGRILGTAAYMSPEQAKGIKVDRRTDIFAFGAVFYEMLTGHQAFHGDAASEILASVLKVDPDWSRLPADTPVSVRRVLERSLRKDRNRRFQSAADVRIEIEEALAEPVGGRHQTPSRVASQRRERLAWTLAGALLIAAVGFAIPAINHFRESPRVDLAETRLDIVTPTTSDPASFAISPDGRSLVYVASGDGNLRLWLRPLSSAKAQPLAGTEGATRPFWSPDGKSVAFFATGKLKRLDIGGGLPQALADTLQGSSSLNAQSGTWSPNGMILFNPGNGDVLLRVPAAGGEVVAATKDAPPQHNDHRFPQFLPDGRKFLFYAQGTEGGVYMGSLDSPDIKRLTLADTYALYVPTGWMLYMRQGTLTAQRFDPVQGELSGEPVTVAEPVTAGAFSVSPSGLIAYRLGPVSERRQLTWFDRTGRIVGTLGNPDDNQLRNPDLAPDGRRVAVDRVVQGNSDLWIMDAARITRLTFDSKNDTFPSWSPDGTRIAFLSNRKGVNDVYWKASDGAGSEELLHESPTAKTLSDYSPDGRWLLLAENGNLDLTILPLQGDRTPRLFLRTGFGKINNRFSPDGKWVSYQTDESGRYEIYVRSFPEPGGEWQISTGGGTGARWHPDGKELFYIAPDGTLMSVSITTQGTTLVPGTPRPLFQSPIALGPLSNTRAQYDVAPDGRFLINVTVDDPAPITVLQNWNPLAN